METLKMKAIKIFVLMVLLLTGSSIALSQADSDPDNGTTTYGIVQDVNSNSGEPVEEERSSTFYSNSNHNGGNFQTDEYGFPGSNIYLEGLGSSTSYMNVAHNNNLSQNLDGSIEAWIYVTDISQLNYIMVKGATQGTTTYSFFVQSGSEKLALRMGNLLTVADGVETIPQNTWTHVAVTWDDMGANIDVNFYIDGLRTGNTISVAGSLVLNTDDVRIGGAEYPGVSGEFNGFIDEVRLWNPVLTQSQIRANRFVGLGERVGSNNDVSNFEGSESYAGLISSWTFNTALLSLVFDNISGYNGILQGTADYGNAIYGYPMPYNNALYFPSTGGDNNLVNIRDTTSFDNFITADATIEMWVRFTANPASTVHLISKGSTVPTNSFLLGMNTSGNLFFNIAGNAYVSTGPSIPLSDWTHIAVTWLRAGNDYNIKFYMNGELNDSGAVTTGGVLPTNSDPIRLGESEAFGGGISPVNAYMDEIKIWNADLEQDTIRKRMFASSTALEDFYGGGLLCAWGFDGNMAPTGRFSTMRGTFDVGTANECRFSSYVNETSTSGNVLSADLFGFPTVIKREGSVDHVFPLGYYHNTVFQTVPDNDPNGVTDVISVGPSFPDDNVTSVELFMSVEGVDIGDLEVTLTSPSGESRTVISNHGGTNNNIHTIFRDGASQSVTSTEFLPPWSNGVQPSQSFGNFNNSLARGDWTVKVADISSGSTAATFFGWGIRLNGQGITGIQQVSSEVPGSYELSQNYPNPFNPETAIRFSLPKTGFVTLKVYDILGKEVATLVNEQLNAGVYEHSFDGAFLSSGTYFYRLESGSFTEVKRMVLVK